MEITDEMIKDKILEAVRKEIKKKDMSQAELGKLIGVGRSHVNNILQGTEKAVSLKRVLAMANALSLKVDVRISRVK